MLRVSGVRGPTLTASTGDGPAGKAVTPDQSVQQGDYDGYDSGLWTEAFQSRPGLNADGTFPPVVARGACRPDVTLLCQRRRGAANAPKSTARRRQRRNCPIITRLALPCPTPRAQTAHPTLLSADATAMGPQNYHKNGIKSAPLAAINNAWRSSRAAAPTYCNRCDGSPQSRVFSAGREGFLLTASSNFCALPLFAATHVVSVVGLRFASLWPLLEAQNNYSSARGQALRLRPALRGIFSASKCFSARTG